MGDDYQHQSVSIADRTAVVVGGTSGIGEAIALGFATEGADVVATSRTPERVADTAAKLRSRGADTIEVTSDVTDRDSIERLRDETVDAFGGVDVLVNNAGIYIPGDSQELDPEEWDEVIGVDLDGSFLCAKYAIPHLKEASGALINIGSVHASQGGGGPSYASAKAAVVNLTRDLAVELGEYAVNVNCICPGFVKTAVQDYHTDESMQREVDHTLLPEVADPEDIGDVAVFLASEEASFVHGESIYVDGGWTAHRV